MLVSHSNVESAGNEDVHHSAPSPNTLEGFSVSSSGMKKVSVWRERIRATAVCKCLSTRRVKVTEINAPVRRGLMVPGGEVSRCIGVVGGIHLGFISVSVGCALGPRRPDFPRALDLSGPESGRWRETPTSGRDPSPRRTRQFAYGRLSE